MLICKLHLLKNCFSKMAPEISSGKHNLNPHSPWHLWCDKFFKRRWHHHGNTCVVPLLLQAVGGVGRGFCQCRQDMKWNFQYRECQVWKMMCTGNFIFCIGMILSYSNNIWPAFLACALWSNRKSTQQHWSGYELVYMVGKRSREETVPNLRGNSIKLNIKTFPYQIHSRSS